MPLRKCRIFSTCPPSNKVPAERYLREVVEVARWSEAAGCEGILVYTDNGLVDPWLVAQVILDHTESLSPLVAVQPAYMHPFSVAKMVTTLGLLHGRRVWMNLVAGGFRNDLMALADETPHDRRYERLVEYAAIVQGLLEGDFYRTKALRLIPPLDADLLPGITISGSSEAGLEAARAIGAIAIQYPEPVEAYRGTPIASDLSLGIRIGILARDQAEQAWELAHQRFPPDRAGQLAHQMAMKVSDSVWHQQLSDLGARLSEDDPYWLVPFQNYKTFCPYLVGSYDRVATEVRRYIELGYETFILDVPASPEELEHIGVVFERAAVRRQ